MSTALGTGLSPVRAELNNGVVTIVQETALTPAVTLTAAFPAGSMFDPAGLQGLAYLTARVMDRGTRTRTASHLAEELDNRGVSLKISANRQSLMLACTCLSEDFEYVLGIVADVLRRPVFPESEVEKRRAEVLTLLRQNEDSPATRAVDAVLESLYGADHPYGRPSKGTVHGVERVTRDDLVAFHARRIRPAGLCVVIAGDVPASLAVRCAAAEFEGWAAEPAAGFTVPSPLPAPRAAEQVIAMPGKPQSDIACGFPAVRRQDPRYYACWMMNNILGQFGLGGRLADNIRERQGMAYYAFSTLDPAAGAAPLLIRAGVDPVNVERAVAAIRREISVLASEGPTAKEVDESRAYLIGSIPRLLETNQSIAAFLQSAEEYRLGLDFHRRLPGLLRRVTIGEIADAAAEFLRLDRAAFAIAGPPSVTSQSAAAGIAAAAQ